jgi:hypothetical protein
MTKEQLSYFQSTYLLFDKFYNYNVLNNPISFNLKNRELCVEAKKRIMQLDYSYSIIKKLDDELIENNKILSNRLKDWYAKNNPENNSDKIPPKNIWGTVKEGKESHNNVFIIELHAEHFYYIAFRLRNIIRYLPGLGKKFESVGIRNVRNLIIEHPEKSEILGNGFSCGSIEIGPTLKCFTQKSKDTFHDKGLYPNAKEFKTNFENMLTDFHK